VRESVWAPVLLKTSLVGIGMLLLAALGVASTWASPAGAPVVESALALRAATAAPDGGAPALPAPAPAPSGDAGAPRDKIVLNLASAEELTRLPSVGPKRAQAIVELRARLHGFKRTADLLRIRGIGPRGLKRMLPYLVLDPPSPPKDAGAD
jgi:competence protein ComEA